MFELVLGRELLARDGQAPLHLGLVVGAASRETLAQRLERRRRDEDLNGVRQGASYLARALDLDLEHHAGAAGKAAVELAAQRPVAPARVVGVLYELAGRDTPVKVARQRKWYSTPSRSPSRGARVVAETDSSSPPMRSINPG